MNKGIACAVLSVGVVSLSAVQASVFDDAAFYFNANTPNTSGKFSTGDLPDYRYAGDPTHPLNKAKTEGVGSCVKFRTEQVVHPFAGVTNVERCLYLEKAYGGSGDSLTVSAGAVRLPDLFTVTNAAEFTVVMRFRWDAIREDVSSNNVSRVELFDLAIGSKCGYYLAFNRSDGWLWMRDGSHSNTFKLGASAESYGVLTNVWTDLAVEHLKNVNGDWIFQLYLFDEVKNMRHGQWRSASVYNADKVLAVTACTNAPFRIGAVDEAPTGPRSINTSKPNTSGARAFSGSISQFAVWSRALSQEEVAEAFSGKTLQFEYGVENGLSSEFAGTGDAVTANVTNAWYHFPASLTAAKPNVSVVFSVAAHEALLPQILRFVPTPGSDAGDLALSLNGQPLATRTVTGGEPLVAYIPPNTLLSGANTLAFAWQGSGTLGVDAVSCGGSWQIGFLDNSNAEYISDMNRYQRQYYHNSLVPAAFWKTRSNGYVTAVEDYTDNNIHFMVPPTHTNNRYRIEIPARCGWSQDSQGGIFVIYLNGVEKSRTRLSTSWQTLTVDLPRGGLKAGGNLLRVVNENGSVGASLQYDCFRLIARRPPTGLGEIVIIR